MKCLWYDFSKFSVDSIETPSSVSILLDLIKAPPIVVSIEVSEVP